MSQSIDKLETHFEAALALATEAQRAEYLERECPDPEFRQEVESLLESHQNPDSVFAERPQPLEPIVAERLGSTIGRYRLLETLGEGGWGVVYMAEQTDPVRRRVALKVIKLGMDTRSVVARFEAERQALAMMDHPNIAKVLDGGSTEQGRPYFVMELVRGIRITDYCDQNRLSVKERLGLFIQVCSAVQHAHHKGIIHRDIKPSNILVTFSDGVPVPKIIDFGIAKATEGRLTDATVSTRLQDFVGTPAYMSPEQVENGGLDTDTRADIYSLGVVLYELLAGSTPFDANRLLSSGLDAMRRTIREKDPVPPSTRVATLRGGELTGMANLRSVESPKLVRQIKGDLDWIVTKCLEKDRDRRYDTADALAGDIRRYLANAPVLATPPRTLYRFQKLVQRNKPATFAVAGVALALVVGTGLAMTALLRERTQAARTETVTFFINQLLSDTLPSFIRQGDLRAARDLINTTDRLVSSSLSTAPAAELVVRYQLWRALIEQLGDYSAALHQGEAIGRLAPRIQRIGSSEKGDALQVFLWATRLWAAGAETTRQDEAMKELDGLCAKFLARTPPERTLARECRSVQGTWLMAAGKLERAELLLAEAYNLVTGDSGFGWRVHRVVPDYAQVLSQSGKPKLAEQVILENLNLSPGPGADEMAHHLKLVEQLSNALCGQQRFIDAENMLLERRQSLVEQGRPATEIAQIDALGGAVKARSGNLQDAMFVFGLLATNHLGGLAEWQAATVLALSAGEEEFCRELCRIGVLRFSSVVEDAGALVLAANLLRQPTDETSLGVARAMVERVAGAHDWSKDFVDLLRAFLAHRERRPAEALELLDRFRADAQLGIARASARNKPSHLAELSFFRAMLCAELGREEEARRDFTQGRRHLKQALGDKIKGDRGADWVGVCIAEIQESQARAEFQARNWVLPSLLTD